MKNFFLLVKTKDLLQSYLDLESVVYCLKGNHKNT